MDFYDILLAKKLDEGGSSTEVEPPSVTKNGTYQEEGKSYSPVNVNVPSPYSNRVCDVKIINTTSNDIDNLMYTSQYVKSLYINLYTVNYGSTPITNAYATDAISAPRNMTNDWKMLSLMNIDDLIDYYLLFAKSGTYDLNFSNMVNCEVLNYSDYYKLVLNDDNASVTVTIS